MILHIRDRYLLTLCVVLLMVMSESWADVLSDKILNEEDVRLEVSQDEPYSSSRGIPSFNEWRCFHVDDALPVCNDSGVLDGLISIQE